jgi:spore coat protein SA
MGKIYHLLGEDEPFSDKNGGAISRWVANVLRDSDEIIVCPDFDLSWGFAPQRIYRLPKWNRTRPVHPVLYRLPWIVQKKVYLYIFGPLLSKLQRGDIVYIHNRPECAAVLAQTCKERGIRVILHMHNSHLIRANRFQLAAMRDIPLVFCSEFLRKELAAALPNRFSETCVIYNGADEKKFYPEQGSRNAVPEIIFTGRLVSYKGAHILLEAMRLLEERGTAATCKVVGGSNFGDNSRRTRYVARLEQMCPRNTELVGYATGDEFARRLRRADIFCSPSIWNDPFPLAPLEAMASGLPVVASGVGGIPEALAYGGGILVPPKDAKALAAALQRLVEDALYRAELGAQAAQAFHGHFRWDDVRSAYRSFMRKLTL